MTRHTTHLLLLLTLALGCRAEPPAPEPAPKATPTRALPLGDAAEPEPAEDLDPDPNVLHVRLTAEAFVDDDGHPFYAYNNQRPGPTLRAKVGDRLIVELENRLAAPTTIHWHGIKVPFAMDGVAWMGSPVASGASFTYTFDLTHPGTFWYHPHVDTEAQVDLGLYGAVIVEKPEVPAADHELVLVFDSPDEHTAMGPSKAHGHGRLVTAWTVNGHTRPTFPFEAGTTIRARLINVSNVGYLDLSWPGLRQIAGDQGLLPAPRDDTRLLLSPGDRADVEIRVGGEDLTAWTTPYSLNGGPALGEPIALFDIAATGDAPPPEPLLFPFSEERPSPDPTYTDIVYVFAGSDRTQKWLINGEVFPEITIEELELGDVAIIEVRNLSPSEHPFHIHGLSFEVLSRNGQRPEYKTIEDTINLSIRDVVRLRLVADNPGDWMTHCHILPHADDGMMTVLRVRE